MKNLIFVLLLFSFISCNKDQPIDISLNDIPLSEQYFIDSWQITEAADQEQQIPITFSQIEIDPQAFYQIEGTHGSSNQYFALVIQDTAAKQGFVLSTGEPLPNLEPKPHQFTDIIFKENSFELVRLDESKIVFERQ